MRFYLVCLLYMFAPFTAAQTITYDAQSDAAAHIERLANSHPSDPPLVDPDLDFEIYLPEVVYGVSMFINNCTARLETTIYMTLFPPFISTWADVEMANVSIPIPTDDIPYFFDENSRSAGLPFVRGLILVEPTDADTLAVFVRSPDPDLPVFSNPPEDWPVTPTQEPVIMYFLLHDVDAARVKDLSVAWIEYTDTYCRPTS